MECLFIEETYWFVSWNFDSNSIVLNVGKLQDRKVIEGIIKVEIERVRKNPSADISRDDIHLQAFAKACWEAYRGLSEIYVCESHAYNNKFDIDPDHW